MPPVSTDAFYPGSRMEIKETAIDAARKAGRMLKERLGNAGGEMDRRAEALIISRIRETFPDHGFLTEESAEITSASGRRWIIDPLDGTTNYSHGFPMFCVSIAFEG